MSGAIHPYPQYRKLGQSWLGQSPAHWEVVRVKKVLREVDVRSETGEETHLSMSQQHGLVPTAQIDAWRRQSESSEGGKLCQHNDLVLNRLKAHLGVFAHAPQPGVVSPDYTVLRILKDDHVRFLEYLFKTPLLIAELRRATKGIVEGFWRLYTDDLYQISIPLPPPAEQRIILSWIDSLNQRCVRLIHNKRRLIALLSEQKQAMIDQVVTRGLDATIRFKPSGIDWLGDMPEHWHIQRLKAVARIRYGLGQPPREKLSGIPFLRATNVKRGRIAAKDLIFVDADDVPKTRNAFLTADEIIVVRSGAYTADSAIVPRQHEGSVAGYDMVLTVLASVPRFIAFVLLSSYVLRDQLYLARSRAAQPHLNAEELGNTLLLIPPVHEQERLILTLNRELQTLEQAMERVRQEIDLIREYRTRLIADVVTGQLDVREAAAALPESEPDGSVDALTDIEGYDPDVDPADEIIPDEDADASDR